jgi:hypothetical protein
MRSAVSTPENAADKKIVLILPAISITMFYIVNALTQASLTAAYPLPPLGGRGWSSDSDDRVRAWGKSNIIKLFFYWRP